MRISKPGFPGPQCIKETDKSTLGNDLLHPLMNNDLSNPESSILIEMIPMEHTLSKCLEG